MGNPLDDPMGQLQGMSAEVAKLQKEVADQILGQILPARKIEFNGWVKMDGREIGSRFSADNPIAMVWALAVVQARLHRETVAYLSKGGAPGAKACNMITLAINLGLLAEQDEHNKKHSPHSPQSPLNPLADLLGIELPDFSPGPKPLPAQPPSGKPIIPQMPKKPTGENP